MKSSDALNNAFLELRAAYGTPMEPMARLVLACQVEIMKAIERKRR